MSKARNVKKQAGVFDGAAKALLEFAEDKYRDTYTDAIDGRIARQLRLAARLLRVAGRADAGVGLYQGVPIGEYFLRGDSEDKLARIIHRAQELQRKGEGK
ncbi:MAG: hypothetical protein WC329_08635 [Candidatus Omnitrophota bacterium]|jgi:hypothetical protein